MNIKMLLKVFTKYLFQIKQNIGQLRYYHIKESNETALILEILYITNDENLIIVPGYGKKQFQP